MANTWAVRDVWVLKCPFLADSFVNSFVGRVSLQFRKIRRFHVNCDDVFVFHFPQTLFSFYLLTICPVLLRKDFKSWNGNILVLSCVFHISFVELVNTYDIQNTGRKFTLKKKCSPDSRNLFIRHSFWMLFCLENSINFPHKFPRNCMVRNLTRSTSVKNQWKAIWLTSKCLDKRYPIHTLFNHTVQ